MQIIDEVTQEAALLYDIAIITGAFMGMNHSLLNLGARTNLSTSDVDGVKCQIANLHYAAYRAWQERYGFDRDDKMRTRRGAVYRDRNNTQRPAGGGQRERRRRMQQLGVLPKKLTFGA